jgi:hypothetical protein
VTGIYLLKDVVADDFAKKCVLPGHRILLLPASMSMISFSKLT